jgi:hypothetical protein
MNRSLRVVGLIVAACVMCFGAIGLLLSGPNANAQVGVPYNSSVTASGGNAPYTYSITTGSLPGGLTLNANTGAITGTPNTPGPFTFTVLATDTVVTGNVGLNSVPRAGSPTITGSSSFTITVAPGLSTAPVPPSVWLAAIGLLFGGLYRVIHGRRLA